MMKLQNISSEYQRRPTRIVAGNTNSICDITNNSKSRLATSSNNTSRLKCSTITKVPPANKSRLKLQIVNNIQANSNSNPTQHQQNDSNQSKFLSKLAKPTLVRTRPTSLALKSSQDQQSSYRKNSNTKLSCTTSTLPKLQTKHDASGINHSDSGNNNTKTSSRLSSSSESTPGTKNLSLKTQNLIKRKTSIIRQGSQTISASSKSPESRLSGLKNLVAVVHPQHSQQRVNSSATTSVNKFCSQTITATQTTSTTSKLSLPSCLTTKIVSGKLNSNHKDVNGKGKEERRESKQNEFNLALSRQQQLKTKPDVPPAHQFSNGFTLNSTASTSASTISTYTTSANNGHKNDQFTHCNNSTGHLLSVASNDYDYHDEKQHGNSKQSSNHLSARNEHSTSITGQADECKNENNWRTNNCYNHESAGLTLTKSPLIYSKHNTNIAHSINNYILPKPMGQQVLSLMMLDVGLMPANNNQQHQPVQSTKRSHVCLPSLSRYNFVNDSPPNDQTSVDNHENPSSTTLYDNIFGRNHTNFEQCNDYHSLQPTTDGMFNLQLELPNMNSRNLKSISLPSSPSIRTRDRYSRKFNRTHVEASNSYKTAVSNCRSTHFLRHKNSTIRGTSPASLNSERSRDTDRFLTVYDSQDSQSITSSSCSSLKQCPPLLALSNQLEGFRLDEIVKANTELVQKSEGKCLNESKSETNHDRLQSPDQTSLVLKQHKLLINNSSNQVVRDQLSESDQLEESSKPFKNSPEENELSSRLQDVCELKQNLEETQVDNLFRDDHSNSQLRRQQQPRSHSISGQEFYSNGNYGRLKQSLYSQKNAQELNQNYNIQSGNRMHQTPSPFQLQQLPGRSPSPSSISNHMNYGTSPHDGSFKHSLGRPARNHLHASLECLNSGYSDYQPQLMNNHHHHQQQQHHRQINQQNSQYPQQQNYHFQNQHYAASYLPAPPPANTIINQSGDLDLAAAALGNPLPQQKSHLTNVNSHNYQAQNLINRAMTQVSQSPMRRIGLTNPVSAGIPAGIISHLTSSHHPMRAGHSSLSLASSSFLIEDKLQNEIKKLQSELKSEKEKAEALNSQLNINSSLMAAFEQSLTTLNTRLRQLTTLNEKKDKEIEDLRDQLNRTKLGCYVDQQVNSDVVSPSSSDGIEKQTVTSEKDNSSEQSLIKVIEDLKRQLIEKDRILTDTRLEALSAAHQLEQLESKLNGEHSLLVNEDDLDEGVMVVNHSPSDSDAITDSTHFTEVNGKPKTSNIQKRNCDNSSFRQTNYANNSNNATENNIITDSSPENNYTDNQSNHSSDCLIDVREGKQHNLNTSISQQFNNGSDSGLVGID